MPKHLGTRPLSLDEIVQKSELGQIRLARPEEILALARTIPQSDVIDVELGDWRAINFAAHYGKHQFERIHLLGDNLEKGIGGKISSPVLAMDLGTGLALTRSGSVYLLCGEHGIGEPPAHQIHLLCAALWAWGHGNGLGVVRVGL